MKKAVYRSQTILYPNKWLEVVEGTDIWECSYRMCYMNIRQHDNGKYVPTLHGVFDFVIEGETLPASGKFEFDNIEDAKAYCKRYVDWLRDVWDAKSRELFHKKMHRIRPDVYPA